jgi:hypothetical protein
VPKSTDGPVDDPFDWHSDPLGAGIVNVTPILSQTVTVLSTRPPRSSTTVPSSPNHYPWTSSSRSRIC